MTYAGKLFWQQVSNGHWALGRETRLIASVQELGIRRTLPYALCPMPYALCPMPYTPFPIPLRRRFIVRRIYASTGSVVGLKISA